MDLLILNITSIYIYNILYTNACLNGTTVSFFPCINNVLHCTCFTLSITVNILAELQQNEGQIVETGFVYALCKINYLLLNKDIYNTPPGLYFIAPYAAIAVPNDLP